MGTQKRRDRYYSRVRIPADLRQHISKTELVKSLETTRYRVAKVRAARWESHVSDLFIHLRRQAHGMTKQQIAVLVRHYIETTLEECETDRASSEITQDQHDGVSLAITDALEQNDIDLTFNRLDRISRTTDELLEEKGIELGRGSSEYKRLCREFLKAEQQVLRIELKRWNGDYSDEPAVTAAAPPPVEAADELPLSITPLSEVITTFAHQKEIDGSWRERTGLMYRSGLELFRGVIGDKPIGEITKADMRHYQETLHKLPTSMTVRFPGKSVHEVLAMDDDATQPKLSKSSIDKLLRYVKGLLNWARDNDYIKVSPADSLKLKNPGSQDEQREAFGDEDLKTIFSGDYRNLRTQNPPRYWIPLIMLFAGTRLEEVAQLTIDDVKKVDDVWCIDINDKGENKKLKNDHSERKVPIHPWLVEHGLLKYWEQMKVEGYPRLFPTLRRSVNGYGSAISKWFNKRLREVGVENKRKVLYSTRHTVATRLKYADVQDHAIAELLGHKVEGITMGRYAKKLEVEMMKGVVELLDFRMALGELAGT